MIPLRVGSGTRLKTFEAMALGRPVVSTTLGVEGLAVVPGEHCLIADTAETFGAEIIRLLADAQLRSRLAASARGPAGRAALLVAGDRPTIRVDLPSRGNSRPAFRMHRDDNQW